MKSLREFFWFCSGAHIPILLKTPSEQVKFAGIGGTIFFTGLFASISAGFAIYFISNDVHPAFRWLFVFLLGPLWGALIFNLDRYIVSSMKKNKGLRTELQLAIPRMLLAGIIAVVISKPLELQIFHTSIAYEMEVMQQEDIQKQEEAIENRFAGQLNLLVAERDSLNTYITEKQTLRDQLGEAARKEADGSGGSLKRGAKKIYALKRADADQAQAELDSARKLYNLLISKNRNQMAATHKQIDSLKLAVKRSTYNGFDKQLEALGRISAQSVVLEKASWFIMLLFLAIELTPILAKLLSPRGPYDDLLEVNEYKYTMFRQRKTRIPNSGI